MAAQQKGMSLIEGYQKQPVKVVANVQSQIGEIAILQTTDPSVSYKSNAENLELEKQYVFWLRVTGCFDCRTREAEIIKAVLTVNQIQKDQSQAAKEVNQLTHQIKKQ